MSLLQERGLPSTYVKLRPEHALEHPHKGVPSWRSISCQGVLIFLRRNTYPIISFNGPRCPKYFGRDYNTTSEEHSPLVRCCAYPLPFLPYASHQGSSRPHSSFKYHGREWSSFRQKHYPLYQDQVLPHSSLLSFPSWVRNASKHPGRLSNS
jgi:hypothetical protein